MIPSSVRSALVVALLVVVSVAMAGWAGSPASAKCPPGTRALPIDLERSTVRWRGTKFWGRGEHSGTVRFRGGMLCLVGKIPSAGWLEVDMRTLEVTDIPASDPIPRRRLREHLKSEDFFHVTAHPTAHLALRRARREAPGRVRVSGNLTIRGHTHPITFPTRVRGQHGGAVRGEARIEVDRHVYGVSYRGSRLQDDLVDDTFRLDVVIVASPAARPPVASR